jgi:lysophospholipase L1-like esterase
MRKRGRKVAQLDKRMAPLAGSATPMLWHDPGDPPFRLAGFPWYAQDRIYRRLPKATHEKLPAAVDQLADCTAGGQVSFRTDSRQVAVRVELAGPADMNHMPATGQCGFDLYEGPPLRQHFHNVTKYDHRRTSYETLLFDHPETKLRDFTLNFPLYQGVRLVRIGLAPGARIAPPRPWAVRGRIVVYGTSITQGGCASRPGMAWTNILNRALNVEVANLGFSGSGKGEPEVLRLVAQVADARLFVLDYEGNAGGREQLERTLPESIRILRQTHTHTPILAVSRIPYAADLTHAQSRRQRGLSRDMQARLIDALRRAGDPNVHFLGGATRLGAGFDECTVDGVHPNDLGFMRIAEALEPEVRRLLGLTGRRRPPRT